MTMTKPEIKAEWIKRLRSGQYKQGRKCLCCAGRHCCLGVLAEIAVEQGVCEKHTGNKNTPTQFDGRIDFVPASVAKWAGLRNSSGGYSGDFQSLANLNDKYGKTFLEIADIIESHPAGLFTWEEGEANGQSN